jgi:uncharacterized integral membrane protein
VIGVHDRGDLRSLRHRKTAAPHPMKQLNFLLIFSFGLAMVMFTLENTATTTVRFLPGLSTSMPLAALLLLVGGIGATAAWVFAVWTGVVKRVESQINPGELEAQQVRIRELEQDVERYRATVDAQLSLLPAAGQSSAQSEAA